MKESTKAFERRRHDSFWNSVFRGDGLDIGSGDDPFKSEWFSNVSSVRHFDFEDGDAQTIARYLPLALFDFVHSSHCLEHLGNPWDGLFHWYSMVKPGGYLVITVPDEDMYEQGVFPSRWNEAHRWTFTIFKEGSWSRYSINIVEMLRLLPRAELCRVARITDGYDFSQKSVDQTMDDAEAAIEIVVRKQPYVPRENLTFRHSGARGDLVYGLPTIKALGGGHLFLNLNEETYVGQPMYGDDIKLFEEMMAGHSYLTGITQWQGESVDYDLDEFRQLNVDVDSIARAHLIRFGMDYDLAQPWIEKEKVGPVRVADIIVNRTDRYHGPFDWGELWEWQEKCAFVGSSKEYELFVQQTGLDVRHHITETYKELAACIAGASLFVGNQSFPFSLAEGMKVPRVLEVCPNCPNCYPEGESGFVRLTQSIIRHFVDGESQVLDNDKRHHSPVHRVQPEMMKFLGVSQRITANRKSISCVIPFQEDHMSAIQRISKSGLSREMQVIIVGPKVVEELPSGIVFVEADGSFEAMANAGASRAVNSIICILDVSGCDDVSVVVNAARQFGRTVGIVGTHMMIGGYPHVGGYCLAVSRKAYEKCGLFDESMGGQASRLEINLRYAEHGYASKFMGLGTLHDPINVERKDAEFLERMYGVKA